MMGERRSGTGYRVEVTVKPARPNKEGYANTVREAKVWRIDYYTCGRVEYIPTAYAVGPNFKEGFNNEFLACACLVWAWCDGVPTWDGA